MSVTTPSIRHRGQALGLDLGRLPRHVAFIMDGNGRWATAQGKPRTWGHRAGVKAVKDLVRHAKQLGIEVVTLYAFSTENWRRTQDEVGFLLGLFDEVVKRECRELAEQGVRLKFIGDLSRFPAGLQKTLTWAEAETAANTALFLQIAVNYGGRSEIVHAVNRLLEAGAPGPVTEEAFADALYTGGVPDPDLIVRTSGEMRLSNYLLWQAAYAEIYVTDTLWPDFDQEALLKALLAYQNRNRRFGAQS